MKRLLEIFELTTNEQRVVLIVVLALIAIALVEYERRVHRAPARPIPALTPKMSVTPSETEEER